MTVGEGKTGLEMIPLPALRTVGAHKHCLPPSLGFCSPPPLSLEAQFKFDFSVPWPGLGSPTRPLPAHGGASPLHSPVRAPRSCSLSSRPRRSGPQGSTARSIAGKRPEQGDRHNSTVTQPCAARGARPWPSAGRSGHRAASGSEVRGAAPVTHARSPAPPAAPAPAAPSGTQPPLTSRPPPCPPAGCSPELLRRARVPEPPTALGCRIRVQRGGGLGPRRPGGGRRGRGLEAEERGRTEPL